MDILLIDGSPAIRGKLSAKLRTGLNIGRIVQVGSFPVAERAIEDGPFGIVIMDIGLRGGNSLELVSKIKQRYPCTCIILLTNEPYEQLRTRCKQAGADYLFDKCTEFGLVNDLITKLVSDPQTSGIRG